MKNIFTNYLKPLDLPVLITASALSWIHTIFFGKQEQILPLKVKNFKQVGEIEKSTLRKPFKIGIYLSSDGKKAIGKYWEGNIKDFNYYSLLNEINMYRLLNAVVKRIGKNMPQQFTGIYIPQMYMVKQTKNSLILLLEFVEGDILEKYDENKILSVYEKSLTYLQYLGTQLTVKEKACISRRSAKEYILLYPLLVIKSLMSHPQMMLTILRGIPVFLKNTPALLRNNNLALVHRDLHFNNIILGKKIILIDLQLCSYTDPMYELVTTLRNRWNNKLLKKLLLEQIRKNYLPDESSLSRYQALCINAGTHALTGTNFTKNEISQFVNFLKYAIALK